MSQRFAYAKELSTPLLTDTLRWMVHFGLGSHESPPSRSPLPDAAWAELLACARSERISGLLAASLRAMPTTEEQRLSGVQAHREAVANDLRIERTLLQLGSAFDRAGLAWRAFKGVAAARQLYPDPALRSTGDVDVVVYPHDFDRAVELAQETLDVVDAYPSHGPASEAVSKGHTLIVSSGTEVDIHRAVRGTRARYEIPTPLLFASPQTLTVHNRSFDVPAVPVTILQAMLHLAKEGPRPGSSARLSTLVDLLNARVHHAEHYLRARDLADECGCATPAAWAQHVVEDWVPPGIPPLSLGAPSWRVRAFDRLLAHPGALSVLQRLEGQRKLKRAWEAVAPSSAFRDKHGMPRRGQLLYVIRRLLGRPGSRSTKL